MPRRSSADGRALSMARDTADAQELAETASRSGERERQARLLEQRRAQLLAAKNLTPRQPPARPQSHGGIPSPFDTAQASLQPRRRAAPAPRSRVTVPSPLPSSMAARARERAAATLEAASRQRERAAAARQSLVQGNASRAASAAKRRAPPVPRPTRRSSIVLHKAAAAVSPISPATLLSKQFVARADAAALTREQVFQVGPRAEAALAEALNAEATATAATAAATAAVEQTQMQKHKAAATFAKAAVQEVWHEHVSARTGTVYFANPATRETTWTRPSGRHVHVVPQQAAGEAFATTNISTTTATLSSPQTSPQLKLKRRTSPLRAAAGGDDNGEGDGDDSRVWRDGLAEAADREWRDEVLSPRTPTRSPSQPIQHRSPQQILAAYDAAAAAAAVGESYVSPTSVVEAAAAESTRRAVAAAEARATDAAAVVSERHAAAMAEAAVEAAARHSEMLDKALAAAALRASQASAAAAALHASLQIRHDALSLEVTSARATSAEWEDRYAAQQQQHLDLRTTHDHLQQHRHDANARYESLQRDHAELRQTHSDTVARHSSVAGECSELRRQLSGVSAAAKETEARERKVRVEYNALARSSVEQAVTSESNFAELQLALQRMTALHEAAKTDAIASRAAAAEAYKALAEESARAKDVTGLNAELALPAAAEPSRLLASIAAVNNARSLLDPFGEVSAMGEDAVADFLYATLASGYGEDAAVELDLKNVAAVMARRAIQRFGTPTEGEWSGGGVRGSASGDGAEEAVRLGESLSADAMKTWLCAIVSGEVGEISIVSSTSSSLEELSSVPPPPAPRRGPPQPPPGPPPAANMRTRLRFPPSPPSSSFFRVAALQIDHTTSPLRRTALSTTLAALRPFGKVIPRDAFVTSLELASGR